MRIAGLGGGSRLGLRRLRFHHGANRDPAVGAMAFHRHHAVHQREQGVVLARADVRARLEAGAALPDDDLARRHLVAGEFLEAQPLGIAIPAVPGAAHTFLVCHCRYLVFRIA